MFLTPLASTLGTIKSWLMEFLPVQRKRDIALWVVLMVLLFYLWWVDRGALLTQWMLTPWRRSLLFLLVYVCGWVLFWRARQRQLVAEAAQASRGRGRGKKAVAGLPQLASRFHQWGMGLGFGVLVSFLLGMNETPSGQVLRGGLEWLGMGSDKALYYNYLLVYQLRSMLVYLLIPGLVFFVWVLVKRWCRGRPVPRLRALWQSLKVLFGVAAPLPWRFYVPLLPLIGLPVMAAALLPSFLASYPRVSLSGWGLFWQHFPLNLVLYEALYALQFFALECFFRSYMVKVLRPYLGTGSVWLMAGMYYFIHFHKPPLEAISSFFGGVVLGVVVYKTGNSKGGTLLHIFIALLMELSAALMWWLRMA